MRFAAFTSIFLILSCCESSLDPCSDEAGIKELNEMKEGIYSYAFGYSCTDSVDWGIYQTPDEIFHIEILPYHLRYADPALLDDMFIALEERRREIY